MIIRGTCSIGALPDELKMNIEITSIVDKFLEHSRILIFHNEGDELVYLTSADWMMRNLNSRVEMACPVFDASARKELIDYFNTEFSDNMKARVIDADQLNHYKKDNNPPCRSQEVIYTYLKEKMNRHKSTLYQDQPTAEPERSTATA